MDTNREAVYNLISLLVKKSGFDVGKNLAEEELIKTREELKEVSRDKRRSTKETNKLIEKLKDREDFWLNNAEVIGKDLLNKYLEGKRVNEVEKEIDKLTQIANKSTENVQVSGIYVRIKELNNNYNQITEKINKNNYVNYEEREFDYKFKTYLESKISSLDAEIEGIERELDNLKEEENKDAQIVDKLTAYNNSLEKSLDKLLKASKDNNNSDISFELWEKLETTRNDVTEKLEKAREALMKTRELLEDVRGNRQSLSNRKNLLEDESMTCKSKLANVERKIEEDDYINASEQVVDQSKLEMITLELTALDNKKDVIYVDAFKVKEELLKAWENRPSVIVKDKEETPVPNKQIIKIEKYEKKEEPVVNKQEDEKNKYELEW